MQSRSSGANLSSAIGRVLGHARLVLPLMAMLIIFVVTQPTFDGPGRDFWLYLALWFCVVAVPLAILPLVQRGSKDREGCLIAVVSLSIVVLAWAWLVSWGFAQRENETHRLHASANNLFHLAHAMHEYEEKRHYLPPAAVFSQEGKPLLSWRVLILPYIEQEELFKQFRLDEPWDSPHNIKLLGEMPEIFGHPEDEEGTKKYLTHYRVFVGPGAAFEGKKGLPKVEFTDGKDETLLIVEAAEAVPWTKPEELSFDDGTLVHGLLFWHRSSSQAVTVDGHVNYVKNTISEKTLRALITRNAGDKPGGDW